MENIIILSITQPFKKKIIAGSAVGFFTLLDVNF